MAFIVRRLNIESAILKKQRIRKKVRVDKGNLSLQKVSDWMNEEVWGKLAREFLSGDYIPGKSN